MPVVEALHQARTERRLEVDVVQSYGELTRMDTDAHDHGEPPPFSEDNRSFICFVCYIYIYLWEYIICYTEKKVLEVFLFIYKIGW